MKERGKKIERFSIYVSKMPYSASLNKTFPSLIPIHRDGVMDKLFTEDPRRPVFAETSRLLTWTARLSRPLIETASLKRSFSSFRLLCVAFDSALHSIQHFRVLVNSANTPRNLV